MMECTSGQHDAIQQGDGDTDRHTRLEAQTATTGAVQVDRLPHANVAGWDDVRLLIDHKPNVTDETFIKDGVNRLLVVGGSFGEPTQLGLLGWLVCAGHAASLEGCRRPSLEWWKVERASTSPSSRVTVTQTSMPGRSPSRLPVDPCRNTVSPTRA